MSLLTDIASIAAEVAQFFVKLESSSMLAKTMESQIKRACFWGGLLAACVVVLLAGIGLIIAGVWILLSPVTGAGVAAIIVGVVVMVVAVAITMAIKSCIR
jgi:uncharacterized membrane protein YhaH (DUF805 family)